MAIKQSREPASVETVEKANADIQVAQAAVQEQPEPLPQPAPEPVVAAPVSLAPVVLNVAKIPPLQQQVSAPEALTLENIYVRAIKTATGIDQNALNLVNRFKHAVDCYFKEMTPGKMLAPKEGAYQQYLLCEALIDFFKNENDSIHRLMWNYFLISTVQTYGKRFELLNRYMGDEWTYGKDRYDFLLSVANLVMWTAVPATRAIGIKKIAEQYRFKGTFWTQSVQANMTKFYNL